MHGKGVLLHLELKKFGWGPLSTPYEPHMELAAAGTKENRQPRYKANSFHIILMPFPASRPSDKSNLHVSHLEIVLSTNSSVSFDPNARANVPAANIPANMNSAIPKRIKFMFVQQVCRNT